MDRDQIRTQGGVCFSPSIVMEQGCFTQPEYRTGLQHIAQNMYLAAPLIAVEAPNRYGPTFLGDVQPDVSRKVCIPDSKPFCLMLVSCARVRKMYGVRRLNISAPVAFQTKELLTALGDTNEEDVGTTSLSSCIIRIWEAATLTMIISSPD